MIRPDFEKWGQSPKEIHQLSLEADHPRSRERYQALYMIGTNQVNATQWAKQIGRKNQTVMEWVHKYNELGPTALLYERSGGRLPLFAHKKSSR